MKVAGVISGITVTAFLAGCATFTTIPPEIGRPSSKEEQQRIFDMPNNDLLTMAGPSRYPCDDFYVRVSPPYLHQDSPAELSGTLAHELGHVIDRDWTPERAAVPQIQREREADAFAIRVLNRLGVADCQAQIEHFRKIRERNIREMGVEQKTTVGTHPSFTERIKTFETGCRTS